MKSLLDADCPAHVSSGTGNSSRVVKRFGCKVREMRKPGRNRHVRIDRLGGPSGRFQGTRMLARRTRSNLVGTRAFQGSEDIRGPSPVTDRGEVPGLEKDHFSRKRLRRRECLTSSMMAAPLRVG